MTLYTVGYEGATTAQFWQTLLDNGIEILMDVRSTPMSRKPGFSKGPLQIASKENGLSYEHWKTMGCPKDILNAYREDKDWETYTHYFWRYLRTREDDVRSLAQNAKVYRCALMCFEADPNFCHRSYVAQFAKDLCPELKVVHLVTVARNKVLNF